MSNRLYGDLLRSSGRRYYFALDSTPGIVTPGVATLTLNGRQPVAVEQLTVFRTPATAVLTLQGQSLASPTVLTPAPAALSTVGQIPGEVTQLIISPALPAPVYETPASYAPTLLTIWTTQPGVASLTLQTLEQNVTQGGNIGFVSPGPAQISLGTLQYTLLLLAGQIGVGSLSMIGRAPTLQHELTINPGVGTLTTSQLSPEVSRPFTWVDDDPAPTSPWITDAAA
jgi:hypothetical protein